MLPEVQEISRRRRKLGLTQNQLAKLAGVSQSMVAKLEGGRIDAAYSKVKHIFEKLEELEAAREAVPARKLSNKHVIGVQRGDSVSKAIGLMRKHDYSQLPVFDGERVVGSISEGSVTEYLAGGFDPVHLSRARVSELMEEAFPQVGEETPHDVVVSLLRHIPAVLTVKESKVTGIVTKADLFKIAGG